MVSLPLNEQIDVWRAENHARLRAAAAAAFQPRILPEPSAWAPRAFWLSPDVEAGGGPYDLERRPWWRELLACLTDPHVRRVIVPASTQVGKTLNLICCLLYLAEHAPAPAMVVLPNKDAAVELRDRVYLNAEKSHLSRVRVPPERRWNDRHIDLGTMRVYLAWSGSRQRLRGRPCKYVFLSEIDVYQRGHRTAGDPVSAGEQRVKAFWSSLIWMESSPSEYPSRVVQLREHAEDQREWWCPCPQCGRWQPLRFFPWFSGANAGRGGVVGFAKDDTPDECRRKAKYACLSPGCDLTNEQVRRMRQAGRWISVGQRIDRNGQVTGERPVSRQTISYQLWSIHSEQTSIGEIAAKWAEARDAVTLGEFYGNWLGLSYNRTSRVAEWKRVATRLAAKHQRGTVPPEAWFLTAGADVQEDRVYWVVRAWGPWITSYLVDWGEHERLPGDGQDEVKSDLARLTPLLHRSFQVADGLQTPVGHPTLTVRLLNCDSNYGGQGEVSRVLDVHRWIRSLPDRWTRGRSQRVRAVRGDSKLGGDTRWRRNVVESNARTGEPYPGGLEQWGCQVRLYYPDLLDRLTGRPGRKGSWHVCSGMLEEQDGKKYLRQICNFAPRDKRSSDGTVRRVWGPRESRVGNDFWDCEIYAYIAAQMVMGLRPDAWTLEGFRKTFIPRVRDEQQAAKRPRPPSIDER